MYKKIIHSPLHSPLSSSASSPVKLPYIFPFDNSIYFINWNLKYPRECNNGMTRYLRGVYAAQMARVNISTIFPRLRRLPLPSARMSTPPLASGVSGRASVSVFVSQSIMQGEWQAGLSVCGCSQNVDTLLPLPQWQRASTRTRTTAINYVSPATCVELSTGLLVLAVPIQLWDSEWIELEVKWSISACEIIRWSMDGFLVRRRRWESMGMGWIHE